MPRPRLEVAPWWPEVLALKDRLSLRDLSARFNVSINGLSRALRRAGSPKADSALPGGRRKASDAREKASARYAVEEKLLRGVEGQDWWPQFLSLKDTHTLSELARRFDVAEITLQRAMKRAGIARRSLRGVRPDRPIPPAPPSIPNRVVPTPPARPSALPDRRPNSAGDAFLARVRTGDQIQRFVVVARDMVEAIGQVQSGMVRRAGAGSIIEGIEYLGPAL